MNLTIFFVGEGNGSTEAVSVMGSILTQIVILNTDSKLGDAKVCPAACHVTKYNLTLVIIFLFLLPTHLKYKL